MLDMFSVMGEKTIRIARKLKEGEVLLFVHLRCSY